MAPGRLFLARHCEADFANLHSFGEVYAGLRYDFAPLSAEGRAQANKLAIQAKELSVTTLVSSPYTRALETAAVVATQTSTPIMVDLRLHDWLPVRSGLTVIDHTTVVEKIRQYDSWKAGTPQTYQRTWETDEEMSDRLSATIADWRAAGRVVLIITHQAVIQSITGQALSHGGLVEAPA